MQKLSYANRFKKGELYDLDGLELKFLRYEVGEMMVGPAYVRSIFLDVKNNKELMYDARGLDFKPKSVGANIIHFRPVKTDYMNEKYGHKTVDEWEQRFNEIIETGLVSLEPLAPTQSQISEKGDPFDLFEEAYGIKLWLLYNYGYFYLG